MWLRFAAHGSVAKIWAVQAITRMHSSNMSNSYYVPKLPDFEQRKKAFDIFFEENGHRIPKAFELRRKVLRILAEKVFWDAIVELFRGRIDSFRQLLRFAFSLDASLRYRLPLRRAAWVFGESAERLFSRTRRALSAVNETHDAHLGGTQP
jgi:hypothetical protein